MADLEDFLRNMVERAQQGRGLPEDDDDLIIDAELVDEPPTPQSPTRRSTGQFVSQHAPAAAIPAAAIHGGRPAPLVDHADERMEDHLREVFEHRLGDLGDRTPSAADSTLDTSDVSIDRPIQSAADIVTMIRNPQSLRNLVVLSEILQRPDHW